MFQATRNKRLFLWEIFSDIHSKSHLIITAVYFGHNLLFGCLGRKQTKEKKMFLLPNNYVLSRYLDEGGIRGKHCKRQNISKLLLLLFLEIRLEKRDWVGWSGQDSYLWVGLGIKGAKNGIRDAWRTVKITKAWHVFVCFGLPWSALFCFGLPWFVLVCHGLPWAAMVCIGMP